MQNIDKIKKHLPYIGKICQILPSIDIDSIKTFMNNLNILYYISDEHLQSCIDLFNSTMYNVDNNYSSHNKKIININNIEGLLIPLSFLVESNMNVTYDNLILILIYANIEFDHNKINELFNSVINDNDYMNSIYSYKQFVE